MNSSENINYYNVLQVPANATQQEIKKAYRALAAKFHPDKQGDTERMKVINAAYKTLSDATLRADYDSDRDYSEDTYFNSSGFLPSGHKLSDEYKAKIKFWTEMGPSSDQILFSNLNLSVAGPFMFGAIYNAYYHFSTILDSAASSFENLLKAKPNSVHEIFESITPTQIFPAHIWNWSHTKAQLLEKEKLNSKAWNTDLPQKKPLKSFSKNYRPAFELADDILNAVSLPISFPNTSQLQIELYHHYTNCSSTGLFDTLRDKGSTVSLCPESMQSELGYIPKHTVWTTEVQLDKEATQCSGCEQSFGLFLWKSNCMKCGTAYCNGCLQVRNDPEYIKPVQVCNCCKPEISYKADWITPLNDKKNRNLITSKYLTLLDILGHADKQTFSRLVDLFLQDGRYDLAIQCHFSAGGDWLVLADKFLRNEKYDCAKTCLDQIKGQTTAWWNNLGNRLSENQALALMCYQQANFKPSDYLKLASNHSDLCIRAICFVMAMQKTPNKKNKNQLLQEAFKKAVAEKNYQWAVTTLILSKTPLDIWIQMVNTHNPELADYLVQGMHDVFKCDWNSIEFIPDRDHLRWRFLGPEKFNVWLKYLENLLKKCDGQFCIPYFRSEMRKENFVVHRDHYLSQKDYSKALLCHCLIPNRLSWQDLAKKWRHKDEVASLACHYMSEANSFEISNQFCLQGDFSMALRVYLQEKYYNTILNKSKSLNYDNRLLYQIALWRTNAYPDTILDVCETLLMNSKNIAFTQTLLIGALKSVLQPDNSLRCLQLLTKTGISDLELLGLLKKASSLCTQETDKKWFNETLANINLKLKNALRKAIFEASLKDVFPLLDLIHPLTLPVLKDLFKESKIANLSRGPNQAVYLVIRALAHLTKPKTSAFLKAMNDMAEAILGDPSEESLSHFAKIIEKISQAIHHQYSWILQGEKITSIQQPSKSEFTDRLQRNPMLKMLIRSEAALAEFKPLEAAMSYIDLCMAISNAPGLVGGFLTAAWELLKAQKELETQTAHSNKIYAYRRAIVDLVTTAYVLANSHLCPSTQLYAIRSAIAILTASYQKSQYIQESERRILEELYREMDKLSAVIPTVLGRLVSIYDLIFIDLINRRLNSAYLTMQRNAPKNALNPAYQYYLFEGTWKGWLDEEAFKFEEERESTMKAFLKEKGHTMEDVENLMNRPLVPRTPEGWLHTKATPLELEGQTFSRVEGIRFNLETGEISLLLEGSSDPMEALFDMGDVADVMKKGIKGAFYTLEQPDPSVEYHPFQNEIFGPSGIAGTKYLATLRQTDVRMKEMSMGTEVSSLAPFALRNAEKSLFQRLPSDLQQKFADLRNNIPHTAGRVHRFWIEAGDLKYYQSQEGNTVTFTFGACKMSVKKHMMRRDSEGKLVDMEEDTETDSPEAKFAELMTKEFDRIGKYFLEFARLKELVKLQAMSAIAQHIYHSHKKMSEDIKTPKSEILSDLENFREQITYPLSTNIESMISECLRKNKVSRREVSSSQLQQLRKDILKQCEEADDKHERQIAKLLSQKYHADQSDVLNAVWAWLNDRNGAEKRLVSLLKTSAKAFKKTQILRICKTFEQMEIATEAATHSLENLCSWLPAAFRRNDHSRVYGGVVLGGNLVRGGGAHAPPPGNGGPVGPGASGTGYRHVVSLNGSGQILGTTTCVDRVSGNTYNKVVELNSCVRDQWNQQFRKPDVAAGMQSRVGYTDVHHYTRHRSNDAVHIHNTNGYTTCTNAQGNTTTYRSGNTSHRCAENNNSSKWPG